MKRGEGLNGASVGNHREGIGFHSWLALRLVIRAKEGRGLGTEKATIEEEE